MSFENFFLLAKTQNYLSVVVALLCFYRYKSRAAYIRLIGVTFLIGFVADQSVLLLGKYQIRGYYNLPPVVYTLCNVCLLSAAYYYILGKKNKLLFILAAVLFMAVASSNLLLYQKESINSYTNVLQALIVIVFAILYFYKLLEELPEQFIHRLPMFWINSAFLIFYSGTFILHTFTSYLTDVLNDDLLTYWSFHNILKIVHLLLIFVGLCYDLSRVKKVGTLPGSG